MLKTCFKALVRRWSPFNPKHSKENALFVHTTGRWLWNEPLQQKQHTRFFDLTALKEMIAKIVLPGCSPKSVRLSKLAEGGSNKIFLATTKQQRLIVKIADPVVPSRLVTASEVATLQFLRDELGLPVPKVLAWNDDEANTVGCEYIVMEEAPGQTLNEAWPTLSDEKKCKVIDGIISIQARLLQGSRKFDSYGSLYLTEHASQLGLPFNEITSSSDKPAKYCVGPLATQHLMKPGVKVSDGDGGPWKTAYEYIEALISSSSAQIRQNSGDDGLRIKSRPFSFPVRPVSDTSTTALLHLLNSLLKAMSHLVISGSNTYAPTIWHRDLHLGNIFISPDGNVTSVIDWQDTAILPLFFAVRMPQFVEVDQDEVLLDLPANLHDMSDVTQDRIVDRFRRSMLQQYYLATLREKNSTAIVFEALTDPTHTIMGQAESFAQVSHGYEEEALLLRQCLINLKRHWSDLFPASATASIPTCPIHISDDEIDKHQIDGGYYNQFKDLLVQEHVPIADEGWVHRDEFDTRRKGLDRAVHSMMKFLGGSSSGSGSNSSHTIAKARQEEFQSRLNIWNISDRYLSCLSPPGWDLSQFFLTYRTVLCFHYVWDISLVSYFLL